MTRQQITEEVLQVIARFSETPPQELLAAESLEELVDSMARIEIIFELEDRYNVEISDEEVLGINTVDDLAEVGAPRLRCRRAARPRRPGR